MPLALRATQHFRAQVQKCLDDLPSSFHRGELAYLSLTAKSEQHLRDHLAFSLQRKLKGYLVCREWRRHDLAILSKESDVPEAVIEAKVMYTFDALTGSRRNHLEKLLEGDIGKLNEKCPGSERMILLFLTHPQTSVPEEMREAIKFARGINGTYRRDGGAGRVLRMARQRVQAFWKRPDVKWVRDGTYAPGGYQGVGVLIPFWLAGV